MIKGSSFRDPKYLVLIIYIGISAIIALGGFFYYDYRKELRMEDRLNDLKAIADLKEANILSWKAERLSDANTIINNPFVRKNFDKIFIHPSTEFAPIFSMFVQSAKEDFDYKNIFVFSHEGKLITSTSAKETISDEVIQHYLAISKNSPDIYFSGFDLHQDTIPLLDIVIPVTSNGTFGGFGLMQIDPNKYLFPLIEFWPTPSKSSETLIFSSKGDEITFLNKLRHLRDSKFQLKIPLTKKKVAAVMAVEGTLGFVEAEDYRGKPIIAYLKKIPGTDWFMVAKTDQDELFQPMKQEAFLISGVIIILLSFIGFISYLILRNYVNSFFIKKVNDELGLRSAEDISHRKNYELQIRKLNRLYSTLISINQMIVRAKNRERMLHDLCDILIDKGGYRMVSVEEFSSEGMKLVASAGHLEGYYDHMATAFNDQTSGSDPTKMTFRNNKLVVCQDIDTDPLMAPWRDEALKRGYRSFAAFPIILQEVAIGVVNIFSSAVEWFDNEEIVLLEHLVNDVGYALGFFFIDEERREIREELIASEEKFQQVFKSMNDGVAIHELVFNEANKPKDYRILDVNPMFETITSLPAGQVIGALASELYHVDPPPYFDTFTEVALTGRPTIREVCFAPMEKHFRISVFSQKENGFTTVFQNITEQVEAREYLKKMNVELEKRVAERTILLEHANSELKSFAYSVSHDLKTPLRSISGFASILESRYASFLDETGKHYLRNINQAGQNMDQLIEDLLRYSRLGKTKPEFISLDLKALLESCISDLNTEIASTHATITLHSENLFVNGNPLMLNQMFTNLILNGLKYQPDGQKPEIDISWVEEDPNVIISVKDNGIGITEKFYKKVFLIFQRLHREDQYQGTGIGLAIVKKVVEIHEGEVYISESKLGSGSTFCVKLLKSNNS